MNRYARCPAAIGLQLTQVYGQSLLRGWIHAGQVGIGGPGRGKQQVIGGGGAGPPLHERLLTCRPAASWRQAESNRVQVGHVGVELGPRGCQDDGFASCAPALIFMSHLCVVRWAYSLAGGWPSWQSSAAMNWIVCALSRGGCERGVGWPWCSWGPYQRGHGRDVQGEQQRYGGCRDQRERQLADRRTGRGDVEQLESGEGAEGQGRDQVGHAERVEPQGGAAASALREPACDQRRGEAGGDVA